MMPLNIILFSVIFGILYIILLSLIQRKLPRKKGMIDTQKELLRLRKEIKQCKTKEDVLQKQKEAMVLFNKQIKIMLINYSIMFGIFLVVYYIILPFIFPANATYFVMFLGFNFNYHGVFLATIFISGIIMFIFSLIIGIIKKSKRGQTS